MGIALAPVVTDCIGEDGTCVVEVGGRDGTTNLRVALETVLGVLVQEMEGTVTARGAKCAVLWVEGDGIDRVDIGDVALIGDVLTVALEREI